MYILIGLSEEECKALQHVYSSDNGLMVYPQSEEEKTLFKRLAQAQLFEVRPHALTSIKRYGTTKLGQMVQQKLEGLEYEVIRRDGKEYRTCIMELV
jgi:hypothetical protein